MAQEGMESEKGRQPVPLNLGEAGQPGVLLIHGFAAAPTDFGELPWALEEAGFRVVAPLLPGHGGDPKDLDETTVEDLSEHVRETYWKMREESDWAGVVGFSMGGALALQLTRDAERPPDALVLAAPYFRIAHKWYYILPVRTWNALLSPILSRVVRPESFTPVNREEGAQELFIYDTISTRFVKELGRLGDDVTASPPASVPERTMMIRGAEDGAASIAAMEEMADRLGLPREARKVLPRSNHAVFVDYDREEAVGLVVEFLRENR